MTNCPSLQTLTHRGERANLEKSRYESYFGVSIKARLVSWIPAFAGTTKRRIIFSQARGFVLTKARKLISSFWFFVLEFIWILVFGTWILTGFWGIDSCLRRN